MWKSGLSKSGFKRQNKENIPLNKQRQKDKSGGTTDKHCYLLSQTVISFKNDGEYHNIFTKAEIIHRVHMINHSVSGCSLRRLDVFIWLHRYYCNQNNYFKHSFLKNIFGTLFSIHTGQHRL